jgi:hypothetical protein
MSAIPPLLIGWESQFCGQWPGNNGGTLKRIAGYPAFYFFK